MIDLRGGAGLAPPYFSNLGVHQIGKSVGRPILMRASTVFVGGTNLDKIDPKLKLQLAVHSNRTFPVIITCRDDCAGLLTQLKAAEVTIGEQLIELNMLTTSLSGKEIEEIALRSDVEQIALDEEARTQETRQFL